MDDAWEAAYGLAKEAHHTKPHAAAGKHGTVPARRTGRMPKTNSLSLSGSRPAPALGRIADKQNYRDMIQYSAFDSRVVAPQRSIARKTMANLLVPAEGAVPQPNISSNPGRQQPVCAPPQHQQAHRRRRRGQMERLASVIPGLCVANAAGWRTCSAGEVGWCAAKDMVDSRTLPYRDWYAVVKNGMDFINARQACHQTIIIHCDAGVNRSSSIVAAYLISNRGYTADGAVATIVAAKQEIDPAWDTLTNPGLRRHLQTLERHGECALGVMVATEHRQINCFTRLSDTFTNPRRQCHFHVHSGSIYCSLHTR